jgi:hypothetical protein
MSETVDAILRQFEYNKSKRTNWESQWSEVADYFLPNQSGSFRRLLSFGFKVCHFLLTGVNKPSAIPTNIAKSTYFKTKR